VATSHHQGRQVYIRSIANMSNYITSGSLTAYQPVANMAAYITSGSLVQYQSKFWVAFEYLNTGPAVNSFGQVNISSWEYQLIRLSNTLTKWFADVLRSVTYC
jgi:hypothetical protein